MDVAIRALLRALLVVVSLSGLPRVFAFEAVGTCSASGQGGSKAGGASTLPSGGAAPSAGVLGEDLSDVELLGMSNEELLDVAGCVKDAGTCDMSDEELLEEEVGVACRVGKSKPKADGGTATNTEGADRRALDPPAGISRPDIPRFYASLCIDALIIAVVVHGARCWFALKDKGRESFAPAPSGDPVASPPPGPSLLEAVRGGDLERCMVVLEVAGPSAARRMVRETDMWGITPLHHAAKLGSAVLAKLLLTAGAEADAAEAWEQTPLHFAAHGGSVEVCKMLLANGASMNAVDSSDHTPLLLAAHANNAAACELLMHHGAGTGGVPEEELPAMLIMLLLQRMVDPSLGAADGSSPQG